MEVRGFGGGGMLGGGRGVSAGVVLAVASVVGIGVVCWWLTFVMAADFYGGGLRLVSFGGIFLMWAVMMAAMMTPSFLPALLLFAKWQKNGNQQSPQQSAKNRTAVLQNTKPNNAAVWQNLAMVWVLACGYLVVWAAFSLAAAGFQQMAQLNSALILDSPFQRALLLFVAGAFQFSRLKLRCLRGCRHPAMFFVLHFRRGIGGAFVMGAHNGLLCAGCCGLLMALLFVGGVMDIRWIAALALWALAEKTLPVSPRKTAAAAGVVLLGAALGEMIVHYY